MMTCLGISSVLTNLKTKCYSFLVQVGTLCGEREEDPFVDSMPAMSSTSWIGNSQRQGTSSSIGAVHRPRCNSEQPQNVRSALLQSDERFLTLFSRLSKQRLSICAILQGSEPCSRSIALYLPAAVSWRYSIRLLTSTPLPCLNRLHTLFRILFLCNKLTMALPLLHWKVGGFDVPHL